MVDELGFYWVCYGDGRELTVAEHTEQGWFLVGMEEPAEKADVLLIEFISSPRFRG